MTTIEHVCQFLARFAPPRLAEDWDNTGLLVGDRTLPVTKIMTCLTVTPASAAEAVETGASLIVSHHPSPFKPLKRITADNVTGQILLQLIGGDVAVYSPHTSFDSAATGINQMLAEGLGIVAPRNLQDNPDDLEGPGAGRFGDLEQPVTLAEFAARVKQFLQIDGLHAVGAGDTQINRVGVACGSAGTFLPAARRHGCDLLVTGETNFHTCLEAEATGVALLLPGHYASERFAVEKLAEVMAEEFPALEIWPSQREADPLRWIG